MPSTMSYSYVSAANKRGPKRHQQRAVATSPRRSLNCRALSVRDLNLSCPATPCGTTKRLFHEATAWTPRHIQAHDSSVDSSLSDANTSVAASTLSTPWSKYDPLTDVSPTRESWCSSSKAQSLHSSAVDAFSPWTPLLPYSHHQNVQSDFSTGQSRPYFYTDYEKNLGSRSCNVRIPLHPSFDASPNTMDLPQSPDSEMFYQLLGKSLLEEIDAIDFESLEDSLCSSIGNDCLPPFSPIGNDFVPVASREVDAEQHDKEIYGMRNHFERRWNDLEGQAINFDHSFGSKCLPSVAGSLLLMAFSEHASLFHEILNKETDAFIDFERLLRKSRTTDQLARYYECICESQDSRIQLCRSFLLKLDEMQSQSDQVHLTSPVASVLTSPRRRLCVTLPAAKVLSAGIRLLQAHKTYIDQTGETLTGDLFHAHKMADVMTKNPDNVTKNGVEELVNGVYRCLSQRVQAVLTLEYEIGLVVHDCLLTD